MINYDYEECKQTWKKGAKWSNRAGLLWKSAHETDGGAVFFKIWKGQGVLFSYILFSSAKRLNKKYAFYVRLFKNGSYQSEKRKIINIPRQSRGYFLCGRSPMLPATPHAALVRLAICIGPSTHTGISPSPFPSHIAAIPNIYTFFFCLIIFHQQSLLLSHNLLNCFCHFILEWPSSVL